MFIGVALMRAVICAYLHDEAMPSKIIGYEHSNYPKEHAYQIFDIIEKP